MRKQAQASRVIAASPDRVWRTLTSKEGMKAYMMGADVEAEWRVGGRISMHGEYNGQPFNDAGEVRTFEPQRRLAYTHESSAKPGQRRLVIFELQPREGGTEVRVVQEGEGTPDDKTRAMYEKTWSAMLENLETAVRT